MFWLIFYTTYVCMYVCMYESIHRLQSGVHAVAKHINTFFSRFFTLHCSLCLFLSGTLDIASYEYKCLWHGHKLGRWQSQSHCTEPWIIFHCIPLNTYHVKQRLIRHVAGIIGSHTLYLIHFLMIWTVCDKGCKFPLRIFFGPVRTETKSALHFADTQCNMS